MRNEQVVYSFLWHNAGKSLNMWSDGKRLFSYNTIVAEHKNGVLYVNDTKYSSTTSKQTSNLRSKYIGQLTKHTTVGVPYNTQCDLDRFV